MSARILVFPKKALVRTRALRLEKQRKEQKDLRAKALVRTELKSEKEEKANSVQKSIKAKSVFTVHAREAGTGTAKYLRTQFRNDLKAAGNEWRAFALQLWSSLHPIRTRAERHGHSQTYGVMRQRCLIESKQHNSDRRRRSRRRVASRCGKSGARRQQSGAPRRGGSPT